MTNRPPKTATAAAAVLAIGTIGALAGCQAADASGTQRRAPAGRNADSQQHRGGDATARKHVSDEQPHVPSAGS